MLEAEKFYEQNLKTLERENAALRAYIRDIEGHTVEYAKKWGSPKTTPLDHSAEFNTRKVYE
jgi:hypothetical protein